jgi:hypothetical protein
MGSALIYRRRLYLYPPTPHNRHRLTRTSTPCQCPQQQRGGIIGDAPGTLSAGRDQALLASHAHACRVLRRTEIPDRQTVAHDATLCPAQPTYFKVLDMRSGVFQGTSCTRYTIPGNHAVLSASRHHDIAASPRRPMARTSGASFQPVTRVWQDTNAEHFQERCSAPQNQPQTERCMYAETTAGCAVQS